MADAPTDRLKNPPVVEAIFDVDCDLPPGFDLAVLEKLSRERFENQYPKFRAQFIHEYKIEAKGDAPLSTSSRPAIQAFQFLQDDERQLVQIRAQGFSFNRLAPYSGLDDYVSEIKRTWRLYVDLVSPVQIRAVRLRYINRMLLPMTANTVDLDDFLKVGPRLPDENSLSLTGFLIQQAAIERETDHQLNLVLTSEAPANDKLPVILDVTVASAAVADPADWEGMRRSLESLRSLKNRVFRNMLTTKCIALFQA